MTILNFNLSQRGVFILTDTLLTDADQHDAPFSFGTKVFPLPHMRGLITGTGLVPFISEWFTTVNSAIAATNMKDLDRIAPHVLPALFARHRGDDTRTLATTIYHFGFERTRDRFIGFRYRSAGGFRSKRLPYGNSAYPFVNRDLELNTDAEFPGDFIRHAQLQKEQLARERVAPVGGHLIAFRMEARPSGEVTTGINVCHEFSEDQTMFANLATSRR